ncbi:MAG: FAD-dependent oxidoreductase [Acetobacterales bacterium]
MTARTYDTIIVGGGLVGTAIAYGLVHRGERVMVLDEGDVAHRASRGNFGLVWVQGKGSGMPEYAHWTRRSADLWGEFAGTLGERAGIDIQHRQPGGISYCLSEQELENRRNLMHRMSNMLGPDFRYEILDRKALLEMTPHIGDAVVGGCYCPHDGAANSLRLLRALHAGAGVLGVAYSPNDAVQSITFDRPGFTVRTQGGAYRAGKVVLAAGNATAGLAPMVGLSAPLRPQRGQVIVTQRVRPFLDMPTLNVRQTGEGSVMIGDSKEEVGYDDMTTPQVISTIARRAVATFPLLRDVPVVRTWGALRVMSPDGHPIYQQSRSCPGAFVTCVHSGVTLAAAHAGPLAAAIAEGRLPVELDALSAERFDVQAA